MLLLLMPMLMLMLMLMLMPLWRCFGAVLLRRELLWCCFTSVVNLGVVLLLLRTVENWLVLPQISQK